MDVDEEEFKVPEEEYKVPETEWEEENQMAAEEWENEEIVEERWTEETKITQVNVTDESVSRVDAQVEEPLENVSKIYLSPGRDDSYTPKEAKPGEFHLVNIGFGQNLKKMPREGWEAERPLPRPALMSPASKVRFTYTGTPVCTTTEQCIRACQEQQKYYMDLGFPDIPYNFLVGGDGIVYHGRGWQKQADRSPNYLNLKKNCIDVAYIGNFETEPVPFSMLSVGADFIKYGLKVGKITPFFQVYSFVGEKHA